MTAAQALVRLRGDWTADIAAYDTLHEHIPRMAGMLSDGIIQQFPERLRSGSCMVARKPYATPGFRGAHSGGGLCAAYASSNPAGGGAALLVAGTASPASAVFSHLHSKLSGAAIGGRLPEGEAKLDQSGYPVQPSRLEVRVKNVNLPDGTVIAVAIEGTPVGVITLSRGEGRLATTIQFQVGRQSPITITHNGLVILRGTWLS